MSNNFDPRIAYGLYKKRLIAFSIAAVTAFVMSAYFVVGYLVGDIKFWSWGEDQWLNALPGIGICMAMTAFQIVLYSKDSNKATAGTVLAICIAAGFSILSEIGQGMERDEIRMTTKSKESGAYQAVLGSINGAAGNAYTPYSRDLQQANSRLATCRKKLAQGVYKDCDESEARVWAVKEMITMTQAAQGQRALALSATAKEMERDENNYHPLVNLIRTTLGLTGIIASFLLSLTIIIFFEYAFHYLGRQLAETRDLLFSHGYDTTTKARQTPRQREGMKKPETRSPKHPTRNEGVRVDTDTTDKRVDTDAGVITEEMQARYNINEGMKAGEDVSCPWCETEFKKRTYNHRFCNKHCKDDWHNAANPDRLQHKGKGAG